MASREHQSGTTRIKVATIHPDVQVSQVALPQR
jgi:hypothetical protein